MNGSYPVKMELDTFELHYLQFIKKNDENNAGSQEIIGIAGIGRDITQIQQTQSVLKQTNEELKQRNEDLQTFISVASHDLKSPLHTLSGYLELIKDYCKKQHALDQIDYIDRMKGVIHRQEKFIDDLLYYSKVGLTQPEFKPTDLNKVVQSALENLSTKIQALSGRIEVTELPILAVNRELMVQVYQNLIGNALKYRRSEVKPHIEIGVKYRELSPSDRHSNAKRHQHWLFVKDNGIGLDPKDKEKVFGIFQRLTKSRDENRPGTGAGLALTKRIVEIHKGRIWYESNKDQPGTTFYFTVHTEKS